MPVRGVVARDQDYAAGEAVQAMDDAGPQVACDGGKLSKTVQDGVDQGARVPAGASVNHHSRGLVDGDDIGVFV